MIDTLEISKRLLKAKDNKAYAEEIAHILKEREQFHFDKLATKDDIQNVRNELNSLKTFMVFGFTILGIIGAANLTFMTMLIKMSVGS
jgi:hypothetical protein